MQPRVSSRKVLKVHILSSGLSKCGFFNLLKKVPDFPLPSSLLQEKHDDTVINKFSQRLNLRQKLYIMHNVVLIEK